MQKKLQLLFVLLFGAELSRAQYVEAGTNIINCSDMPAASVQANMASVKYTGSSTKGQVVRHVHDAGNGTNANVNAKVSSRFEVATSDLNILSWDQAMGYDSGVCNNVNANPTSWAGTGCASVAPAGTWRVPTQRELVLIYILRSKLSSGGFSANRYWSATECITSDSWYLNFGNGFMDAIVKNYSASVRCVRDL